MSLLVLERSFRACHLLYLRYFLFWTIHLVDSFLIFVSRFVFVGVHILHCLPLRLFTLTDVYYTALGGHSSCSLSHRARILEATNWVSLNGHRLSRMGMTLQVVQVRVLVLLTLSRTSLRLSFF